MSLKPAVLACLPWMLAAQAGATPTSTEILTYQNGVPECLGAGPGGEVSLQPCMGDDSQQWYTTPLGAWSAVHNVAMDAIRPRQCLFADARRIRMEACNGSGYTSHRQWQLRQDSAGLAILNKYIGDLRGARVSHLQAAPRTLAFGPLTRPWQRQSRPDFVELMQQGGGCLALAGEPRTLAVQRCNGSDTQQWAAWGPPGQWQWWKNRAQLKAGRSLCLHAGSDRIGMESCTGAGHAAQRRWKTHASGEAELLSNDYLGGLRGPADSFLRYDGTRLTSGTAQAAAARWQVLARYGELRNEQQGSSQCLALAANRIDVGFATCNGTPEQDWELLPFDASHGALSIRSRALAGNPVAHCLDHRLKMVACSGSGYTSMRTWRYTTVLAADGAPSLTLDNKYLGDLGRRQVLGVERGQVRMVPQANTPATRWRYRWPLQPHAKRPVLGDQRVLLLHAQWSDRPATSFAQVRQAVFGAPGNARSLADAVRTASGGRTRLTGDAVTGIDLGPRPANCTGYAALRQRAVAQARAKGYDRSRYDYLFIEVPPVSCSWAAIASRPGQDIFAQGSGHKHWMWQHEFGHNLGGPHATALQRCPRRQGIVQVGAAGCASTTASDPSDTLNGGGRRLYPLPYAYYAGWVDEDALPIAEAGRHTLAPLFGTTTGGGYKGLRLLRDDGSWLVLEFRQRRADPFEDWDASHRFVNGVIARIAHFSATMVSNQLIDTVPETSSLDDAPLLPGQSLDDLRSGMRITVERVGADGAVVNLTRLPR